MANVDFSAEIRDFKTAALGEDVRDSLVAIAEKLEDTANDTLVTADTQMKVVGENSSSTIWGDSAKHDVEVNDIQAEVNGIKAAVGSPLVASTKAAMTDHDKVYVYVGYESGMTNGNWYYYNGTDFVSGGVYQSQGLETDKTLSVENMAADAKKVGDVIAKAISSGVGISPTNYESYFTDANNAPRNHSYTILGTITEAMMPNLPVYGTNGMLFTISGKSDGTNVLLQLYATYNTTFFRSCNYSQLTWTEWKEIASKKNVDDVVFGAGIIHNLNYTSFFTDANDAPRNHSYTILGTITRSMVANLPVYGSNGLIITFDGNGLGTNVLLQLYATYNTTFFRSCNYSQQTWTEWKEMASKTHVYHVGPSREYTSFTQCIWDLKDDLSEKIIYVDGGVYDIVQEYEDADIPVIPDDGDYNSGYTPYNAWIPKNTRVVGLGNVIFRYSPSAADISVATSKTVSPLNTHQSCIIENVTIEVKNGRYALHCDGQGNAVYSDSDIQFRNVRFIREINDEGLGWSSVVGIGLDKRQLLTFDKCIFETRMPNVNFYAHNRDTVGGTALTEADSSGIILNHCIFVGAEDTSNLIELQYRSTTNLLRIPIKIIDCYIGGTIHLQQQASGVQNCFDLTILNSGNPTIVVDDQTNPYPAKIYG